MFVCCWWPDSEPDLEAGGWSANSRRSRCDVACPRMAEVAWARFVGGCTLGWWPARPSREGSRVAGSFDGDSAACSGKDEAPFAAPVPCAGAKMGGRSRSGGRRCQLMYGCAGLVGLCIGYREPGLYLILPRLSSRVGVPGRKFGVGNGMGAGGLCTLPAGGSESDDGVVAS